jgi:3-oxoacyl-[acyl-carrier-protein] synthase-1
MPANSGTFFENGEWIATTEVPRGGRIAMRPLSVRSFTASSCIGLGLAQTLDTLLAQRSGLKVCQFETVKIDTYIGEVPGVDAVRLPPELSRFDCRNNRLAELALRQDGFFEDVERAAVRWGRQRIGVLVGTSTAGIHQTELAYRDRDRVTGALPAGFHYAATHNSFSAADYLRRRLRLEGPAVAVSCACASSAKVFGSARRMIEAGLIDAALVGGVDSLCLTTLYGFHSLQLTSALPCRPFDVDRDGISIGEAAAFALLERPREDLGAGVLLLGVGESSDAYHMSAPHPEGHGARRAMQAALDSAALDAASIDYINLHGTGTPSNDRSESQAVGSVFGSTTPSSSTKGATGHALGAAGALEAAISVLALQNDFMPGGSQTTRIDPTLTACYIRENRHSAVTHVLSNSFGFGGTNCSLIFGRAG